MKAALPACPRCLLALGDRCVRGSLARGDWRVCGDSERRPPSQCPSWVEGRHGACLQAPSALARVCGAVQLIGDMLMGGGRGVSVTLATRTWAVGA